MRHPFDLDPSELEALDLDFEEQLTDEEAAQVGGGLIATTLALGEEGGCWPKPLPKPIPIDPPIMTTLALGEEGGITKALCEDGGIPITTRGIGEEGGYITQSCAETGCDPGKTDLTW